MLQTIFYNKQNCIFDLQITWKLDVNIQLRSLFEVLFRINFKSPVVNWASDLYNYTEEPTDNSKLRIFQARNAMLVISLNLKMFFNNMSKSSIPNRRRWLYIVEIGKVEWPGSRGALPYPRRQTVGLIKFVSKITK